MKYRNDIQLLRGYCIIIIVFYHANIIKYGYIAVIVFISISGYLSNTAKSYSSILKRYIRLLYPCFTNMCFILLYYYDEYNEDQFYQIIYETLSTFLFYSNYYFIYYSTDYFNPPEDSLFLHHWYISVDMQLYLFSTFNINNLKYFNLFISTYSMIIFFLTFESFKSYNYFSFIPRIWQYFSPKIYIFRTKNKNVKYLSILILISIIFYSNRYIIEKIYQIIIVLFSYLYLTISTNIRFIVLEIIGVISYYIYLNHYPIIKFESFNSLSAVIIFIYSIILYCLFGQNPIRTIIINKFLSIQLFLLELIIFYLIMINKMEYKNIYKNKEDYSLSFTKIDRRKYCCYSKYSRNISKKILIVGDSHAFNLLGNFYRIFKLYKYYIFYKYIHTEFIVANNSDLYDISDYFHLIVNMNLFYDNKHVEYLKYYPVKIISYLNYLQSKSNYLIYFSPTPVLKERMSCKNQKKYIAKNGIDILLYSNQVKYNNEIVLYDISNIFCNKSTCNLNYKGNCIYSDEHHFTYSFYKSIFNYTAKAIIPFLDNKTVLNNNFKCNYYLYKNKILRAWKFPYRGCYLQLYY